MEASDADSHRGEPDGELSPSDRRARALLVVGALTGIALAALGIARSGVIGTRIPEDAVAVMNSQPIHRDLFVSFVGAVASERRDFELDGA